MKKLLLFYCFCCLVLFQVQAFATTPLHLGGFKLGGDIAGYEDRLEPDSERAIRYNEAITEVEVKQGYGFASGLIAFGTCDRPDQIVRIKLKYEDSSKSFYDKLLARFKAELGEPDEYKGDPFHTFVAWKWSFRDQTYGRISLILQHNKLVEDEKIGNAVKITLTEQLVKEKKCFMKKHPQMNPVTEASSETLPEAMLWKLYVPY